MDFFPNKYSQMANEHTLVVFLTVVKQTGDRDNTSESCVFNKQNRTKYNSILLPFSRFPCQCLRFSTSDKSSSPGNHLQELAAQWTRPRPELLPQRMNKFEIRAQSELRGWITATPGRGSL